MFLYTLLTPFLYADMQGSGSCIGQFAISLLGRNAKARMNPWRGTTPFICNIEDEKKLLIRILPSLLSFVDFLI